MAKWFKKYYRFFTVVFLFVLLIGWTAFLDKNGQGVGKIEAVDKGEDESQVSPSSAGTPTEQLTEITEPAKITEYP